MHYSPEGLRAESLGLCFAEVVQNLSKPSTFYGLGKLVCTKVRLQDLSGFWEALLVFRGFRMLLDEATTKVGYQSWTRNIFTTFLLIFVIFCYCILCF